MDAATGRDIRDLGASSRRQLGYMKVVDTQDQNLVEEIMRNGRTGILLSRKIATALGVDLTALPSGVAFLELVANRCRAEGSNAAAEIEACLPAFRHLEAGLPPDVCPVPKALAEAARKLTP